MDDDSSAASETQTPVSKAYSCDSLTDESCSTEWHDPEPQAELWDYAEEDVLAEHKPNEWLQVTQKVCLQDAERCVGGLPFQFRRSRTLSTRHLNTKLKFKEHVLGTLLSSARRLTASCQMRGYESQFATWENLVDVVDGSTAPVHTVSISQHDVVVALGLFRSRSPYLSISRKDAGAGGMSISSALSGASGMGASFSSSDASAIAHSTGSAGAGSGSTCLANKSPVACSSLAFLNGLAEFCVGAGAQATPP